MKAQFKFLSGARLGQVEVFRKAYIGLGRHPLSDVRFDAERDLDVSSRHAAIVHQADGFVLRDLGSKNGTFVNGQRITGDVRLRDGAVIGFGPQGPAVELRILEADTADAPATATGFPADRMSAPREVYRAVSGAGPPAPPPPPAPAGRSSTPPREVYRAVSGARPPAPPTPPPSAGRSSTTVRIAVEVARQTKQLRRTTKLLFGALLLTAGSFAWLQWTGARDRERELARLQTRADSLAHEAQQLMSRFRSELQGLRDALAQSQSEVGRLRRELGVAGGGSDEATVARLRAELEAAEQRQRGLVGAATVDYRRISQRNQDAVAIVLVEFAAEGPFTGTAFAVDSQGTLVTNKHVLVGESGDRRAQRIAVKFSGSKQWWQGRLIGVSEEADIGVLKVDIRGGTPRVVGIARDPAGLQRGDPVAILGYPLGLDLPMAGQGLSAVAEPTLTAGTVSKVLTSLVQIDGYGAPGSSGSPIFDRDGRVVAILYGGERESQGKIIYAAPAFFIAQYLKSLGVSAR